MSITLDESQDQVVSAIPSERQIVVAGPGAGKTEVVSSRLVSLVEKHDVDPEDGVLVISFSNVAVQNVASRLRERDSFAIASRTLDSIAAEILRDSDVDTSRMTFDDRVAHALEIVREEGWEVLDDLEHLVVDEVQDIVGIRADFLLGLLSALPRDAGFTLLGDPAQAIFDFQLEQGHGTGRSTMTSSGLLDEVAGLGRVERHRLTGQYRAESRDAKLAMTFGEALSSGGDSKDFDMFVASTAQIGDLGEAALRLERQGGHTAYLTRTNGEALLVADVLRVNGVHPTIRRRADDRLIRPELAHMLADWPSRLISRDEFVEHAARYGQGLNAESTWRAFRAIARGRGASIDLAQLSRALTMPRPLPVELSAPDSGRQVVSTVHRAKGLEFDDVVLIETEATPWQFTADEDRRTAFVALTRARRRILRAHGPGTNWLRRSSARLGANLPRWYLTGPLKWQTHGFEIGTKDLDRSVPPGSDPSAVQDLLRERIGIGSEVNFRLDPARSTLEVPVYQVEFDGVRIATTTEDFGSALASRVGSLERRRANWPVLTGARIAQIETVAGLPQRTGPGRHGMWLAAVIVGMLKTEWNLNL